MKRIRDSRTVPQDGAFVYVDPDSGKAFYHHTPEYLKIKAKKHRVGNNYPIGAHWNQDFIDNVCANTPGDVCVDDEPLSLAEKAANFAKAMATWAKSGFKTASDEVMKERQAICENCQYYKQTRRLGIVKCMKCGCVAGLKLFLATEKCPIGKWNAV